jgi:hypothetical protein
MVGSLLDSVAPHNKQLQRTVIRRHVRAAGAPFHYAPAARWTAHRAAAELRRYASGLSWEISSLGCI